MSYDELAKTFGGSPASARDGAIECELARYKGSDGVTYVGLSPAMTAQYIALLARQALADAQTAAQVASLKDLAAAMRGAMKPPNTRNQKAA